MIDPVNHRDETTALPEQGESPVDTAAESAAANTTPTATPGLWLRQAREQAGLSEEQVAKDLFLDTKVIRALEVDRYKDIGAPVYAKGYLRRYAKLLGVEEAAVIERYEAMQGTPRIADPVPTSHNKIPAPRRSLPAWVWWIVILALAVAAATTLLNGRGLSALSTSSTVDTSAPSVPVTGVPAPADTPLAAAALAEDQTADAARTAPANNPTNSPVNIQADTQVANQSATPLAAPSNIATTTAAAAVPGMVSVQLRFSANSWVEIYDANQKAVMYEMGASGTTHLVRGLPPLRVTLGSVAGVKLAINGEAVPIPPASIQANVAHFDINAAGHIE